MDLKRKYNEFNREYFGGNLPDDVRVTFSTKMPTKGMLGGCHTHGVDECRWTGKKHCKGHAIRIAPFLKKHDCFMNMTLLHEMAHMSVALRVGGHNSHSYLWQQEMRRLVNIGAFDDDW